MIKINRNACGRYRNWLFGLACIADGFVRVASFGVLDSDFMMIVARQQARYAIQKLKQKAIKEHRRVLDRNTMPRLK